MKTNINCNLAIIIIGFILYSCNSSSDTKKDPVVDKKITKQQVDNPYFPASVGNKWEYSGESATTDPPNFTIEIVSINKSGKDAIVELSSFPFFDRKNEDTKLKFKENGEVDLINGDKEDVFIPETGNLKKDYTWAFGYWNAYISSVNESVTLDQEKIDNCVKLNYGLSITMSAEIWIAKDKGIVRWGLNRTNPPTPVNLFSYYKLTNFTLGK